MRFGNLRRFGKLGSRNSCENWESGLATAGDMPSPRISPKTRQAIARRAAGCCEYCRMQDTFCPDPFSIEHIVPKSLRGTNREENLAYACLGCNNAKAD